MTFGRLRAAGGGWFRRHSYGPLIAAGVLVSVVAAAAAVHEWPRIVMLLVVAPLVEEALFRSGMQEILLRRWPAWPAMAANALTAVAFGAAHALARDDATAFAVVIPALVIGVVYERTGKLRYCVALHAVMNAGWLAWHMAGMSVRG
ncbi:JDVT-CTERM system CAAX-type protease [Ramlibacter sp. AW1]|uniref:JDVT-CTERM system CAAX-type protease n=1 Tax=Ramlibacter aurantiacus TaxID=2801330 RepID=A0A937D582_9BURK|nr:JDVT-CTERM system glutamic-type intramembrane protease [Ramlibacter aurantiacus]MBL0419633.1 JDVT-CTERM system CAAX-type protease [Ramlibacter aurantiacus]